jgi:hypothetical protein
MERLSVRKADTAAIALKLDAIMMFQGEMFQLWKAYTAE